jgi:hypothetical protein
MRTTFDPSESNDDFIEDAGRLGTLKEKSTEFGFSSRGLGGSDAPKLDAVIASIAGCCVL